MTGRELAVARGWADTRTTLRAWHRAPWSVLRAWVPLSLLIAATLLVAVWVVSRVSEPDTFELILPGVQRSAVPADALAIFLRNLLVLALHALACLAGFIAKSSLPLEAEDHTGFMRTIHDRAGSAAMVFVAGATIFSLATQAYALGGTLSTLSWQLAIPPAELLGIFSVHALPELTALFLPLAAWMLAARADAHEQLMAATFATTAIALPVLAICAVVEVTITPQLLPPLHFV